LKLTIKELHIVITKKINLPQYSYIHKLYIIIIIIIINIIIIIITYIRSVCLGFLFIHVPNVK